MRIFRVLVLLLLAGCLRNSQSSSPSNQQITGRDVQAAFVKDFRKYYPAGYFRHSNDTCILRYSIKMKADSGFSLPIFSFEDGLFFHCEQRDLSFSYSIFKNSKTRESFFYGHYDAYGLYDLDTMQIRPVSTLALERILNNLSIDAGLEPVESVKPYIYNLYYTTLDVEGKIRVPLFPYILSYWQFRKSYRNNVNGSDFDRLFPETSKKNLIVISNDNVGALIFKISPDHGNVYKVDEFSIASRTKIPLLRNNSPPEFDNCQY